MSYPRNLPKIIPGMERGSLTPGGLVGKLEVLRFTCDKCDRRGQFPVATLVRELGADAMLTYFREWLTRDCPRVIAARYSDSVQKNSVQTGWCSWR
jgi:hypothetical protein